jgi:hypothetical protein
MLSTSLPVLCDLLPCAERLLKWCHSAAPGNRALLRVTGRELEPISRFMSSDATGLYESEACLNNLMEFELTHPDYLSSYGPTLSVVRNNLNTLTRDELYAGL